MKPAPLFDPPEREGRPALVVFCDGVELWWLRFLKPGFRHVFVAVRDGGVWVTVDPLSPHTEVAVQPVDPAFDLAGWFRARGHVVVETVARRRRDPAPLAPFTCVEAVKRVLGLPDRGVLTPWQLFRRLTADRRNGGSAWPA